MDGTLSLLAALENSQQPQQQRPTCKRYNRAVPKRSCQRNGHLRLPELHELIITRSGVASWWAEVRAAIKFLKGSIKAQFRASADGWYLELVSGLGEFATASTAKAGNCIRAMRQALHEFHFDSWASLESQGRTARSFRHSSSSHFILTGAGLSFQAWRFIHRARTNTLPVNAHAHDGRPPTCRRCSEIETLPHVLCMCGSSREVWLQRHNAILHRLAKATAGSGYFKDIQTDKTVAEASSVETKLLRPDLFCKTIEGNSLIVDVKCPYECNGAFGERDRDNKRHYEQVSREVASKTGKPCRVLTFNVGALGGYSKWNDQVLCCLHVNKVYARLMRRLMVSDQINATARQWNRHVATRQLLGEG